MRPRAAPFAALANFPLEQTEPALRSLGKTGAQSPDSHGVGHATFDRPVWTTMDADRWRRLRPLLDRAIDLERDERIAHLSTLRAEDETLSDDLARLLVEYDRLQDRTLPTALKLVTRALAFEDARNEDGVATSKPPDTVL